MNLFNLIFIGIGLSMDAFAVSVCKGLCQRKMDWKKASIIALFFGFFQAFMPILGYILGSRFAIYIESYSHWIAFALLAFIGIHMIKESTEITQEEEIYCDIEGKLELGLKNLLMLSIATSIDALAVGVSFALLNTSILIPSSIIGTITFIVSILGVFIGYKCGSALKSKAEILGGSILILIGLKILIENFI